MPRYVPFTFDNFVLRRTDYSVLFRILPSREIDRRNVAIKVTGRRGNCDNVSSAGVEDVAVSPSDNIGSV